MRKIPPAPPSGLKVAGLKIPAVLVCLSLLLLPACGGEEGEPEPHEPPAAAVTAAQLFMAYRDDEVSADEQFRGKTLAVTGKVDAVGRDINDALYVMLDPGEQFAGAFSVQCFFDKSRARAVAALKKGQRVTVSGRCDGKFGNVMLRDCAVR